MLRGADAMPNITDCSYRVRQVKQRSLDDRVRCVVISNAHYCISAKLDRLDFILINLISLVKCHTKKLQNEFSANGDFKLCIPTN